MTDSGTIISLNPTPGERVRVISDLHLGHERCEIPSVTSIASICEGTDYLVIAGDLAETRRCAWQQRGMELREEFRALCTRKGVQLIELAGNHDPDITRALSTSRQQCAWAQNSDVELFCEGDTYPRPRYRVPSRPLELFDLMMLCDGTSQGMLQLWLGKV